MIQMIEAHWERNLVAVGVVEAVEIARRFPSGCGKHDKCGVFSKALWTTAISPKAKVPIGVVHRAGRRGRFHNPAGHRGRCGRRTMGIPNRGKEALDRLVALIQEAEKPPKRRRKTRPSMGARAERLENKHRRSDIKRSRAADRGTDD